MNMDHVTKHATRETQIDRNVEKKAYTHDINSYKQANGKGRCVRETQKRHTVLECYFLDLS
jgi:hypothetical protein